MTATPQRAQLARIYGGAILFTIAEAEASREADVAFAVVTAVTVDGKRGFVAHGGSLPPKPSYTVAEQIVSVNVSHLCRLLRADAAKVGLDLRDRFLPPPNSAAFAEIVRPYAELESGIIEAKAIKKRDVAARRAGDRARMIAMGGRVPYRNQAADRAAAP